MKSKATTEIKATDARIAGAARWLHDAHGRRERFAPLPAELAPRSLEEGYAVQDAFVALRTTARGVIAGRKIALTTPQMRKLLGVEQPVAGAVLESTVRRSPARIRAADYVHLLVEFEIAVKLAEDLPAADAPFTRERVAQAVGAVMPAFEILDDWAADYAEMKSHVPQLAADNAWNEGVVLGAPVKDWRNLDLAALRGVARVNGKNVGAGQGADAMGHPFNAVAWVANHLAASRVGLLAGNIVITGSLVPPQFAKAGDRIDFSVERLGSVELLVE